MSFTAELAARLSALDADEVVADDLIPVAARPSATGPLHTGPSVATIAGVLAGLALVQVHGWLAGAGGVVLAAGAMLVWKYHVFPYKGVLGMVLVAVGLAAMAAL